VAVVHIYTQTIHTTQNKQYKEQHKNLGRVRAVPHLCGCYLGICLTTEEKARKNLSQGSRREVSVAEGSQVSRREEVYWYFSSFYCFVLHKWVDLTALVMGAQRSSETSVHLPDWTAWNSDVVSGFRTSYRDHIEIFKMQRCVGLIKMKCKMGMGRGWKYCLEDMYKCHPNRGSVFV
jgi:hypothetical protein